MYLDHLNGNNYTYLYYYNIFFFFTTFSLTIQSIQKTYFTKPLYDHYSTVKRRSRLNFQRIIASSPLPARNKNLLLNGAEY